MSRICCVCGKRPQVANIVSHANNRVKKWVYPNVQKMRFVSPASGTHEVHAGKVCSKCVKAKKVLKVL